MVNPDRLNVGLDHLLRLETGENEGAIDDQLPDVDLFRVEAILDHLEQIALFLKIGHCPTEYIAAQR